MNRLPHLFIALLLSACPAGTSGLDAGAPDAAAPPRDAGSDDGGAGPDAASDAGSGPTVEDLARMLCEISIQGQDEAVRFGAPLDDRCLASDPRRDAVIDPTLAVDPTLKCLPTSPLTKRYLEALTGDAVALDVDRVVACRDKARAVRTSLGTVADAAALAAALDDLIASDEDCTQISSPLLGAGDACTLGWQCPDGTRCEPDPIDSLDRFCLAPAAFGEACAERSDIPVRTCEPGTVCYLDLCVSPRGLGATCGPDQPPCEPALSCGPTSQCEMPRPDGAVCLLDDHCAEGLFCRANFCAPLKADGESCNALDRCETTCSVCRPGADLLPACGPRQSIGGNCGELDDCQRNLYCDLDTNTCALPGDLDAACDGQHPCGAGLSCTPGGPAGDAGVSGPRCQVPPPLGAPCGAGTLPCSGGYCGQGTCVAGAPGDACVADNGCLEGLLCEQDACVDAPRDGAPCTASGRCDEGLYCDGERCQSPPGPGHDCGPGGLCATGAYCDDGSCTAKRPAGLPCLNDVECASGVCLLTGSCTAGPLPPGTTKTGFAWWVVLGLLWPALRLRRRAAAKRPPIR